MTPEANALARILLRHHQQNCQGLAPTPMTVTDGMIGRCVVPYGQLCDRAGMGFLTPSVGMFLNEIAEWCDKNGWPPLNALAVNRETGMPGEGYDEASGCALLEWPEQVRKCIVFGGYPDDVG
jgi:hypothetical protein